jgi:nicotinamidase-related amidase
MSPQDSPAALILIDVQEGFHASSWGRRNNPAFEANIARLLAHWREHGLPVLHVRHLSTEPTSPLRPGQPGAEFMLISQPRKEEPVFSKQVNSAFIGTQLEAELRRMGLHQLCLAGLSTDHCVSTSARMAANLGFEVTVVTDGTATFERAYPGQPAFPAELVHQVALASLSGEFARLATTEELLQFT